MSGALLPLVGLALGMQLRLRLPKHHRVPLVLGVVGKLVLLPLLAVGLASLFGLHGDVRSAAILESAMPTMMTTAALLSIAKLEPELASATVGYSIALSIITLPLWQRVL